MRYRQNQYVFVFPPPLKISKTPEPTDIITKILNCKVFIKLGKLTFAAYLVHSNAIMFLLGSTREPLNFGIIQLVKFISLW